MNDKYFSYAGDLAEEVAEIQKIVPDIEEVADYNTVTTDCGYFLTLICC